MREREPRAKSAHRRIARGATPVVGELEEGGAPR